MFPFAVNSNLSSCYEVELKWEEASMRGERIKKGTVLGISVIIVFLLNCGCAPNKARIRTSETFFESNPSKKMAILSEGR